MSYVLRSHQKAEELRKTGDEEGLRAWIALGDEGRELYFYYQDEFAQLTKARSVPITEDQSD